MLECAGTCFGKHSFLVKCDCGAHIIEVTYFDDNVTDAKGSIEFYGELFTQYKYPYVYLDTEEEFTEFLETVIKLVESKERSCYVFYSYGTINGKRKILGRLEVSYDNLGCLNICFYRKATPKKNRAKEKVVWDICLQEIVQREFSMQCKKLLRYIDNKKEDIETR